MLLPRQPRAEVLLDGIAVITVLPVLLSWPFVDKHDSDDVLALGKMKVGSNLMWK